MFDTDNRHVDVVEWQARLREGIVASEAILKELEQKLSDFTTFIHDEKNKLETLRQEEFFVAEVARKYKARLESNGRRGALSGNSLWETLIIHFASEDGIIRGKEAAETLQRRGYFSDRRSANAAVYTNLAKPIFERLEPGVYQIPLDSSEWIRLRGKERASAAK